MDWVLFGLITLLMLAGNVVDNIIIARHMRDREHPLVLDPARLCGRPGRQHLPDAAGRSGGCARSALLAAEYWRLRDRDAAFASTKAYMTGWGFSLLAPSPSAS